MSLKDNIHLAGTRTTMMDRAYNELYGPESETADYAKRLLELGAVIVGKTKMCAFASAEEPTDQWIDYHCPFNPRGDGYQTPSGSTTGGGAGLAGYPWLDISVGTDSMSHQTPSKVVSCTNFNFTLSHWKYSITSFLDWLILYPAIIRVYFNGGNSSKLQVRILFRLLIH